MILLRNYPKNVQNNCDSAPLKNNKNKGKKKSAVLVHMSFLLPITRKVAV